MYEWLSDSLRNSGTVVTANRRLARVLTDHFAEQQLKANKNAWLSPAILAWPDWLVLMLTTAGNQLQLPTRINAHQSQLLWERCLRKDLPEPDASLTSLVRMAREAWQRLADWQVPIGEVAQMAQNEDQRLFAKVAGRYLGILEREHWVDEAGLGGLVLDLITNRNTQLSNQYTFVGFDRDRPIVTFIREALQAAGVDVRNAPVREQMAEGTLQEFASGTAEFRSAGAWARRQIEINSSARIAIIANDLDTAADLITRRVREGATPGWQHGHESLFAAVNVSYGRRLAEFPAIAVALMVLQWLVRDLSSIKVGVLLRSSLLGRKGLGGRSRLELRLRRLPDRQWSPAMISAEFRGKEEDENVSDWFVRLAALSKRRRELPKQAAPSEWAELLNDVLLAFGWPGQHPLDSAEFQLVNRWRELLNEFAKLGLVNSRMTAATAINRLELMAGETVFQPKSKSAVIQLLGPLEAAGAEFDAVWLTGVTTSNWPPAGSPSGLISRRLQEKHAMPDCTPADTLHYAERLLTRLTSASNDIVCSYAVSEDDREQTVSDLLTITSSASAEVATDPGWYATRLRPSASLQNVDDNVPAVTAGERISGGAGTIQQQTNNPVSAFVQGRLGASVISPQAVGIPAALRGNLIHEALYNLYIELPSSETIRAWRDTELETRIEASVNAAFVRHERNVDAVLQQLLFLEKRRITKLLQKFVVLDGARDDFRIAAVEGKFEFVDGHIRLSLRIDRIDELGDGGIAILDYKTGSKKRLMNRENEAQEIQLFVYACATQGSVSALALVNVDSREIAFDGVGVGYTDVDEWPMLLQQAKNRIAVACDEISRGDIRVHIEQGIQAARPLNLLTRYTELLRDQ